MTELKTPDTKAPSFTANGKTYVIETKVSIARKIECDKLIIEVTGGGNMGENFSDWKKVYELCNDKRFADIAVLAYNRMEGVKKWQDRHDPVMKLCALYIKLSEADTIKSYYSEVFEVTDAAPITDQMELILNGSFDDDLNNWLTNGTWVVGIGTVTYTGGGSGFILSQPINTVDDSHHFYKVSFVINAYNDSGDDTRYLRVYFNGDAQIHYGVYGEAVNTSNGYGTHYGVYGSAVASGANALSTTCYGGYFTASGGLNNYGLIVSAGNSGFLTTSPVNSADVNGSLGTNIVTKTANYTLTSTDHTVIFDGTTLTATLPAASTCTRRIYVLVNRNATALTTSVAYETLSTGVTSTTVAAASSVWIQSNGTSYYQIK